MKSENYCDCFLDDSVNNLIIYSGYCSIKCNSSCSFNCEYCGGTPGFASKYMLNTATPSKPIKIKARILNHPSKNGLTRSTLIENSKSTSMEILWYYRVISKIKFA